ncbi:MAG: hypothetical protein NTX87_18775 [Planctomycetota bacterium]|nr:hypothetical protein [Planctomycetota bacterium]
MIGYPRVLAALLAAAIIAGVADGEEKPVARRIADRTFPSVFQAWSTADNLKGEDTLTTVARHDLVFQGPGFFGLKWDQTPPGLATAFTPESVARAKEKRRQLLALNPNLVMLAEVRYRDAGHDYLPEGHKWWAAKDGKPVAGWGEGKFLQLDYKNPEFRSQVAAQCKAVVESGAVDGVMLDWWQDDDDHLALIKVVRAAIGEQALVLVNANDRTTPRTAPYINGYFMECYRSKKPEDWKRIADTLDWAEKNLRLPRINCLETWYHQSRQDLNLMRAATTLSLTHSDGYCLFSDPNDLPTPDHLHDWYPFWNRSLGKPLAAGTQRTDGTSERNFERGTVVYNPMGNRPAAVKFAEPRTSLATGKTASEHTVPPCDGDVFLKPQAGP